MTASPEWLEADGLGGFASGPATGPRTRRYHALLLTSENGPAGRRVLVNGLDMSVETPSGTFALNSQHYLPDVVKPDGATRIESFAHEPWPSWEFTLPDGTRVTQEIFVPHGLRATVIRWRLLKPKKGLSLHVRPFFSNRDYHALHRENAAFCFDAERLGEQFTWRPYPDAPAIHALTNADYAHDPQWYRNFLYAEERARGLDDTEDLACPGMFTWDLSRGEAVLILADTSATGSLTENPRTISAIASSLGLREKTRRAAFPSPLHRAADAYIVAKGPAHTIVAGYPWFTDWGRDTFIALRGLCLATGWLAVAHGILRQWAGAISEGMVPNRFADHGERAEFNAVDASLWFVVAAHEFLETAVRRRFKVTLAERSLLHSAIATIVDGYAHGTRHHIKMADDGLLAAGEPGVQLTWMDAKVGDWVVTPRIGKPVEVQALWINALHIATHIAPEIWQPVLQTATAAFRQRFWNEELGSLYDVVDVNHEPGRVDASIRPNQIFAVGGLPFALLQGADAARVVTCVEHHLLTPLGLRTLSPHDAAYRPRYEGGVVERDGAYHQGTVWPWLLGAFVEAWLKVHGSTPATRATARQRFLTPLLSHLESAGIGHVSEIADGAAPHAPHGCPWQAWSLGELLRLEAMLTVTKNSAAAPRQKNRPRAR